MEHQEVYKVKEPEGTGVVFDDPGLRHGFAQVPRVVLRDGILSARAVRLYALLLSYAWQESACFPGQNTLAEDMGCDRQTVIRTLQELRQRHLVSWERRGLGLTCLYHIKALGEGYLKSYVDRGGQG